MINLEVLAYAQTPFKEKFGIPRQSGLTPHILSQIIFEKKYSHPDAFRELNGFSHIWVTFIFHEFKDGGFDPLVRPPRLGGNKKVGVFATRSPNRPNRIGQSKVALKEIKKLNENMILIVEGLDLLDGTPIIDVRPFIEEDNELNAQFGWTSAQVKNENCQVQFEALALEQISQSNIRHLKKQIEEVLRLDPRPQYQDGKAKEYGMLFHTFNLRWRHENGINTVISLQK